MREILDALADLGLSWADLWVMTADRRAGTLVVVAGDGRKFTTTLAAGSPAPEKPRRAKAIKSVADDQPVQLSLFQTLNW